jgi:hypothetical protein
LRACDLAKLAKERKKDLTANWKAMFVDRRPALIRHFFIYEKCNEASILKRYLSNVGELHDLQPFQGPETALDKFWQKMKAKTEEKFKDKQVVP